MSISLIHEILYTLANDSPGQWCSVDGPSQAGYRDELGEWAERVGKDISETYAMALALWGDSAPLHKRNSLFLLVLKFLSGKIRKRFWIFAVAKRHICQCVIAGKPCQGRCTLDEIWRVIAWSADCLMQQVWPGTDHKKRLWAFNSFRRKRRALPSHLLQEFCGNVLTGLGIKPHWI